MTLKKIMKLQVHSQLLYDNTLLFIFKELKLIIMDLIVKAYSIKPLRITFKFTICLATVKIGFDFLYYLASGFSMTFPRYVHQ